MIPRSSAQVGTAAGAEPLRCSVEELARHRSEVIGAICHADDVHDTRTDVDDPVVAGDPCSASNWFRSHAIWSGGTWVFERTLTVVGTLRPYAAAVRDRSMTETSGRQRRAKAPPTAAHRLSCCGLYASITDFEMRPRSLTS